MKNRKLFVLIISMSILAVFASSCNKGAHVKRVVDLPENEYNQYTDDNGRKHYVDLGIAYQWSALLWLPVHTSGTPRYVLYYEGYDYSSDADVVYHTITLEQDDVQYYVDTYGIPLTPKLNLWNRFGFWIVLGVLLILAYIIERLS